MFSMSQKRSVEEESSSRNRIKKSRSSCGSNISLDTRSQESEGEIGIIESVVLKNFMCHRKLNIKLGSNVNFIVGRNGSGKSAILTAIVVGLGGKAAITNRGHSMKHFIQNGKQFAEVSVKLRNRGLDAYKHSVYGPEITVERRMNIDGTSSYKLKNSTGALISQKRDDLMLILDQFNIQIDNPVSILNQEISRNFLHSKSPHDKYKFFLKATQLEQMERDYRAADEQRRTAKVVIEKKEVILNDLKEEVQEWEKKYRMHQSMDDLRKKIELLKNETCWAQVAELDHELIKLEKQLNEEKERHKDHVKKADEYKEMSDKAKKHTAEVQEKLNVITNALESLDPQYTEGKEKLNTEKKKYLNYVTENRKLLSEIKSVENDKNELERKIEELRTNNQKDDSHTKHEHRIKEIQIKVEEKAKHEATLSATLNHKQNLKVTVQKYKEEIFNLSEEEKDKRRQSEEKNRHLHDMEASRNNCLRRFGNWVPELKAKIDDAYSRNRFSRKPRGPIGAHIKLKDPKWALAVESCLKSLLTTYCCHNFQDERVLEELMLKTIRDSRRPSIITGNFQEKLYNVSSHAARLEGFCSVLDALIFDDPIVGNICIDQRSIESVLLVEDNKTAREIMSKNPPRKCQEAFTLIGDQIYPSPNYRYYSSTKTRASYLQANIEDSVRIIHDEIHTLQLQKSKLNEQIQSRTSECNRIQQQLSAEESRLTKLRQEIARLQREIIELKNIDDPEQVDVSTLEDEVNVLSKQLEELNEKKQKFQKEIMDQKQIVDKIMKELHEVEEKIHSIANRKLDPLKESLEQAGNDENKANEKFKYYENQKKNHDKVIRRIQTERENMKKTLQEAQKTAERICEKVKTRRSPADIDKEIAQYVQHLNAQEQIQGSKEHVIQSYFESKRKYENISADVEILNQFIEKLDEVMDIRHTAYNTFRKLISVRVRYIFTTLLNQRNFTGRIEFDHQREQLNICIQPTHNVSESTNKDMKSLSGGERSYTTVCFILSLWEAMESPFRVLDEFDVFMDMVTRRVSMDLMLETALTKTSHQFLFLTPQEMSALRVTNDPNKVKIFRMPEPDRNQSILPSQTNDSDSN